MGTGSAALPVFTSAGWMIGTVSPYGTIGPGAGNPGCAQWPEVYRKIRDAGKLIQLYGNMSTLDTIAEQLGSAEGIILIGGVSRLLAEGSFG